MKYRSDRKFKIWGYTVSHGFLLLRSPMLFEDEEGYSEPTSYNIDIEFSAVAYIELPSYFNTISLNEVTVNIPERLLKYANQMGFRVFEIVTGGNSYFIVAGGYRVAVNKWELEDRIINPDLNYDKIIATSN